MTETTHEMAAPRANAARALGSPRPVAPGRPHPLGATWDGLGVNFALFSAHATAVDLLLFDAPDAGAPARTVPLVQRTGDVWHAYLPDLAPGALYGYRVHGPFDPERGHRFNSNKVLLDPYAKALGRPLRWHDSLFGYRMDDPGGDRSFSEADSAAHAPLARVEADDFAWGDDRRPAIPLRDTIVYETHVKGISRRHPDVPEPLRGTYLGLASEPVIEHLLSLGVTSVELLPVQAFVADRHLVDAGLTNYWGYNPLAYFAPEPSYATGDGSGAVREFRTMVRALHAAGLEVLLDVVYNHTGEGNQLGPTLSFKGIDNRSYYKASPENARYPMDYTGTGNTLDIGHPHVLQLVADSLRYWVQEMHVDGFRFDLASTLGREEHQVDLRSAFFKLVQQDPVLSRVKMIAEPWDLGPDGYRVGGFPAGWCEWNGRYRDTVRRYWRGDPALTGGFVSRLSGSPDLFEHGGRSPTASINFVTAHDGFTLQDLVSYEHKHNEDNLEDNQDGEDHNHSVNCGVEGPSDEEGVLACRERAKRNLIVTLFLSQGVPMLLGGDELSRTKRGNNNTYAQDNELTWYDWDLDERKRSFLAFVRGVIAFRKAHPALRRGSFLRGTEAGPEAANVVWWHPEGRELAPDDWTNPQLRAFGMQLVGGDIGELDDRGRPRHDDGLLLLFNSGKSKRFLLPPVGAREVWQPLDATPGRRRSVATPGSAMILKERVVVAFRAVTPG